jgi:hypothetical protein
MGAEALCEAVIDGKKLRGKAKLETATLEFRAADVKVVAPFNELSRVKASEGVLSAKWGARRLAITVGAAAPKWADKILNPPSRLKKLGVKPASRVAIIGTADHDFIAELTTAGTGVSRRVLKNADAIFLMLERPADLARIITLKASLAPDGALWTVRPKGHADISEMGVMAAGKDAGLVDVKVVAFSPTHTAAKFVIPKRDRPKS